MITPNECLFIDRLRKEMNQKEYAQRYLKIGPDTYRKVECGHDRPIPSNWKIPEIKNITDRERFILLRRRKGWTKEQLANEIRLKNGWDGVSRPSKFLPWNQCSDNTLEKEENGHQRLHWLPFFWGDEQI